MNLKVYYQKLRQAEDGLKEPQAVVVSLGTPDGGRAGVLTEAPRDVAAKLMVEGAARLATDEEASGFREQMVEARRKAEQAAVASRLQVTVVAEQPDENKRQRAKSKSPQD